MNETKQRNKRHGSRCASFCFYLLVPIKKTSTTERRGQLWHLPTIVLNKSPIFTYLYKAFIHSSMLKLQTSQHINRTSIIYPVSPSNRTAICVPPKLSDLLISSRAPIRSIASRARPSSRPPRTTVLVSQNPLSRTMNWTPLLPLPPPSSPAPAAAAWLRTSSDTAGAAAAPCSCSCPAPAGVAAVAAARDEAKASSIMVPSASWKPLSSIRRRGSPSSTWLWKRTPSRRLMACAAATIGARNALGSLLLLLLGPRTDDDPAPGEARWRVDGSKAAADDGGSASAAAPSAVAVEAGAPSWRCSTSTSASLETRTLAVSSWLRPSASVFSSRRRRSFPNVRSAPRGCRSWWVLVLVFVCVRLDHCRAHNRREGIVTPRPPHTPTHLPHQPPEPRARPDARRPLPPHHHQRRAEALHGRPQATPAPVLLGRPCLSCHLHRYPPVGAQRRQEGLAVLVGTGEKGGVAPLPVHGLRVRGRQVWVWFEAERGDGLYKGLINQ